MLHGCFLDTGTLGEGIDWSPLRELPLRWQWHHNTAAAEVAARIGRAAVVITNKVVLDAATIAAAPNLRLICIAATGTNNVDLAAAAEHGITVSNVRDYATPAVAQYVMAMILAHATRWQAYARDTAAGAWTRSPFFCRLDHPIEELAEATLGIIGYGALGQAVARLARAFDMRVLVAERAGSASLRAGRTPLEQVLAEADFVSLHCPLTEATHHLLDAEALRRMKSSAYLINTARGPIVNEQALAAALRTGAIAGAALDVLTSEPPPADHPLLAPDIPGLSITPHCSWASRSARQRALAGVAANIRAFIDATPANQVN
ncbi:MAG TPA: D-2-hydroxyacid dehydrogenase [Salinisphaeraceae bacterium]|nr:D-2-hydroxyacid dehydrogenase [Salinisphaeraceae bacterium]